MRLLELKENSDRKTEFSCPLICPIFINIGLIFLIMQLKVLVTINFELFALGYKYLLKFSADFSCYSSLCSSSVDSQNVYIKGYCVIWISLVPEF